MKDDPPQTHKDVWEKASEHWWLDEPEYMRPTSRWAIIVAIAFGLLFWWGVFRVVFG